MKKGFISIVLTALLVCAALLPVTVYADYDEVVSYDVVVAPNAQDGSLAFTVAFDWKALEELPYGQELKIGIPNGSIRDVTAQTDNIERLEHDNSYMYVYLTRKYGAGETFHFAYSWVQEYMYALDEDGVVTYDYTPGWFDEARVDHMTVTWQESDELDGDISYYADDPDCWEVDGVTLLGTDLPYGSQVHLYAEYSQWPTALSGDMSRDNLPEEQWSGYYEYEDSGTDPGEVFAVIVILVIVAVIIIAAVASRNDGYAGGFGTRYVYVNHLWYPAGPDGRPRPGSTGTAHKPAPPVRHSSGGLGGGFGGGGFGGGSHCACASSCACACACACAGGGRAGCSAKNLYGAIRLDAEIIKRPRLSSARTVKMHKT
ncbi:MAG: hypothetical protein J5482_06380 [Oscillospiraceae bacterium]|nr:hypothetical protein [Oscillospiraceae bacterium]